MSKVGHIGSPQYKWALFTIALVITVAILPHPS